MGVIQSVEVLRGGLAVKFNKSVRTSDLVPQNFQLLANTATPVTNAFEDIDLSTDYNSIGRTVLLRFKTQLNSSLTYRLSTRNLHDAAGASILNDQYDFQPATSTAVYDVSAVGPSPAPQVIDHSIQVAVSANSLTVSNPEFYVVETDPENFELYLDEDYNSGRITIKFNATPTRTVVNSSYFKAQRKKVQRGPSKWEAISARVSLDNSRPWVYIDFPSLEDEPVYGTPEKSYFEPGYKYRIKILKNVGV